MIRMHALGALATVVVAIGGSACGGPEAELTTFEAVSASLADVSASHGGVMVGFASGTATLRFTDSDGGEHTHPVTFEGPLVGAALTIQDQNEWGFDPPDGTLELPGPVPADQLFGVYQGSTVGMALVVGFSEHNVENVHGVTLSTDYLTAGVGIVGALQWLTLSLDEGS